MDRDDIKQKTKAFIGQFVSKGDFGDDLGIFESGMVNSLFAMQLVMFVEQDFGISVDNDDLDLENFKSVNAIADFVERKKG